MKALDLSRVDATLGGYSSGFVDGPYACFCPFKTYIGPVGGIRSKLSVDKNHLTAYYNPKLTCIHENAWINVLDDIITLQSLLLIDFSTFDNQLRGYSDVIRVGRYAYLAPLRYDQYSYSGKLIRLYLGSIDIGKTVGMVTNKATRGIHDLMTVIDLCKHDSRLKGFTGIFNGKLV